MKNFRYQDNPNQLLNEAQASELLQIAVRTLQRWRVAGQGPKYKKLGRAVRYRLGDLHDWMDSLTVSSTSQEAGQ